MNRTSFKVFIPLVSGIIGMAAYIAFFKFRNSSNYAAVDICTLLPPIAFIGGIVASVLTRKHKENNNTLWWSGFVICLIGLVLYIAFILLLICAAFALRSIR